MSDSYDDQTSAPDSQDTTGIPSPSDTHAESASPPMPSADDPYYDVPNVGRLPVSELVKGYSRQADYTRKTQALAQQARQFQQWDQEKQAYEQALSQLRDFLQDRNRLAQYMAALGGDAQQAPTQDPDEILTAARAQELLAQREQQLQRGFQSQLEQVRQQILTESLENQYSEAVTQKLRALGAQYPELRSIPGMEGLLRQAVKSQNPQGIDEALEMFDQAAQYYMKTIDGLAQSRVAKVQQTPLARGIEPPTAATPAPPRGGADQYTGVRDPRLRDAVIKDIMRIVSSGG